MTRTRLVASLAASLLLALTGAAPAMASHGGGGGGTTTPPPAGAPAISLSPSTVSFAPADVGTTSAPQTVTIRNTGTAPLFFSGMSQGGAAPLDFAEVDDQCVGLTIAAGTSCTISVDFRPTATGTRTATIGVLNSSTTSPAVITMTGTGTSATGPTPIAVATAGYTCAAGVCDTGSTIVGDFFFTSFSAVGEFTTPLTWSMAGGTLPPGLVLHSNSQLYGTATAQGTFTFTVRVTDATGRTATQAFDIVIAPLPVAGDPRCQHAPSSSNAQLSGAAIGGRTPTGRAIGDQSKLTACGGFVTISTSVSNVNLPNGTVLWVTLGGRPIGLLTLSGGSGSIKPYIYNSDLRKQGILIYTNPPPLVNGQPPLMSGAFF
jgi:hypothetical protein